MHIKAQLQQAQLQSAITTATTAVRDAPQDIQKRQLLCELLCIAGDLKRAEQHWDTIAEQAPQAALSVALPRQLIRAEQARQRCFRQGELPEFLSEITPAQKLILQAMIELRAANPQQAQIYLSQSQAMQPCVFGVYNEKSFTGMRDCDDLCAGFLEVFIRNGKYYWLPFEQIRTLTFHAPEQPLDLIWRRAILNIKNGPEGEVYIPAIYIDTPEEMATARLGYSTDWRIIKNYPITGIGQRLFLIGDAQVPIMECSTLLIEGICSL